MPNVIIPLLFVKLRRSIVLVRVMYHSRVTELIEVINIICIYTLLELLTGYYLTNSIMAGCELKVQESSNCSVYKTACLS